MSPTAEASAHVLRARRTAAVARAGLSTAAVALIAAHPAFASRPALAAAGFAFIIATAAVQVLAPRLDWLKIEESVAGLAGILIVGFGDQRVNVLTLLWLAAVASGVLARGGRVHWIGRLVIVSILVLPVVRMGAVRLEHLGLCLGAIGLLLTCGRLTRELNHLLAKARHDADHDALTGVLSRTAFRATLAGLRGEAALVLVDLDDFGQINKTRGHAAGDAVLREVVERLRGAAGERAPVGRLGGDEFAVIVPGDDPENVAGLMLDALADGIDGVVVPASAGIALTPRHGRDPEALLRAADVALRVAKRSGRQQISVYAGEDFGEDGPTGARAALERLIGGEGIEMVVQPIVHAGSGAVHAYEALARFKTGGGTDSPLHWFALAAELGLRDELEIACLTAALNLLPERPAGTRLSANLSGPLLFDERVQALLAREPDVSALIVEVTEEALVQSDGRLQEAIAPLLERGAELAV
ncbi:MAG: hypothetical protein QOE08_2198, partial [Thermoleophilaceae bacterium]|nr:hypothetical protein [Thermoleophilaceae bacterium]